MPCAPFSMLDGPGGLAASEVNLIIGLQYIVVQDQEGQQEIGNIYEIEHLFVPQQGP